MLPGWPPRSWPGRTSWWSWTGSGTRRAAGHSGAGWPLDRGRDRAPVQPRTGAGRGGLAAATGDDSCCRRAHGGAGRGPVTMTSTPPTWRCTGARNAAWPILQGQRGPADVASGRRPRSRWLGLLRGRTPVLRVVCWGGRWPRCRGLSETGRRQRAGDRAARRCQVFRRRLARAAVRRTWPSRSAPSGSPACGRRCPGWGERLAGRDRHAERAGRGVE